jgi:hypothetical protein
LEDEDDKTRANAAGALGNLVKNGDELAALMSQLQVPEYLLRMALVDKEEGAQVCTEPELIIRSSILLAIC